MHHADPETFLRAFHAELPGATSQIMARGRSDAGSSYAFLADEVPITPTPLTVLDLACGDGYLLELLQRRAQPNLRLIGVDMSEHELQAARQRLGPDVQLYHERAQHLPLPDATVDIVLCHEAFMLLTPLDAVVAELRRILVPNGIVVATIGSSTQPDPSPIVIAFSNSIQDLVQQAGRLPPDLGEVRSQTLEGLQTVFTAETGFKHLTVHSLLLHLDGTPHEVMQFFGYSYNGFALGEARAIFEQRLEAELAKIMDARGQVQFELPMAILRCVRAA